MTHPSMPSEEEFEVWYRSWRKMHGTDYGRHDAALATLRWLRDFIKPAERLSEKEVEKAAMLFSIGAPPDFYSKAPREACFIAGAYWAETRILGGE